MSSTLLSPSGGYDKAAIMRTAHEHVRNVLAGLERAWAAGWRVNDSSKFYRKAAFARALRAVWADAKAERNRTPDFKSPEYANSFEAWGAAYRPAA